MVRGHLASIGVAAVLVLGLVSGPVVAQTVPLRCESASEYEGAPPQAALDPRLLPSGDIVNALSATLDLDGALEQAFERMHPLSLAAAVATADGSWEGRLGVPDQRLHWWASAGKMATAVAILQMVEEGRLSLSDPVSNWVSGVPRGDRITIRMLLDHTSGLFSANEAASVRAAPRYRSLDELVAVAAQEGSFFCPGQAWRYSNTNYWLLGGIIEAIDGQPLAVALTERIVRRAGLQDVRFLTPDDAMTDLVPPGEARAAAGEVEAHPNWVGAAGPMAATPRGMIDFQRALLTGRLLKPETVAAQLARPYPMFGQPQYYGLGLMLYVLPGDRLWVGHSGGAPGIKAISAWSTSDQSFVAVVLTGEGSPEATANLLLRTLSERR
jgi:D-alanyl-D-alanine carboxypeptidase